MVQALRVVAVDAGYDRYDQEERILAAAGARFEVLPCDGDAAHVADRLDGAQVLLVRESRIGAAVLESIPGLLGIVRYGIGVDNIDVAAASRRRVAVANVPDYGTEEVSDQALALLLAVARRVVTRDAAVRDGRWNVSRREPVYRVAGKTLGLVGYGRIARAVERKLRGFGVERVLVFDPFVDVLPSSVQAASLDEVCAQSDYLSLHAPHTPQTHHLLDAARLARMKATAIVVNTGRGGLIDEAALIDALRGGRLFGAGLDVFEREPVPADSALRDLDSVVLSDHTGWYSEESVRDLQARAAHEAARILNRRPPQHWINPW